MSEKIILPHHHVVSRWKEEKVIKWLKKVHLDDCIPAFEVRHIGGTELLELTEQKLFTYQDVKIKHRIQIAKCVQECKSQASHAKRIAKTLKYKRGSQSQGAESNGNCESEDDDDYWDSDFDDFSDEDTDDQTACEVNNNTISPSVSDPNDSCSSSGTSNSAEEKSIPQPPDVPLISKSLTNSSGFKNTLTNSIPRPLLKRPPSQPPPPPVPQANNEYEEQEDYEIPIVSTSNLNDSFSFPNSTFQSPTVGSPPAFETYEVVEPPEENYEIVDHPDLSLNMNEKPLLPPRHLRSLDTISPPPLPQKPMKLKDPSIEGIRTFSRPKLPTNTDGHNNTNQTSSIATNVGFISSIIRGRSGSNPSSSPKSQQRKTSFSSSPSGFLNDSGSMCSTPQDKDGYSSDVKKVSLPPLPLRLPSLDDSGHMATRPLPPVPLPKDTETTSVKENEILSQPWFHEIEREEAETAVRNLNENGSFVVRPSKRAGKENPYSLTVLHEDRLFHLNIRLRADNTFALGKEKEEEKAFLTVPELIIFHLSKPILLKNRGEPAGKTILCKYPPKT